MTYDGSHVPSGGLSFESAWPQAGNLLDATQTRTYAGQSPDRVRKQSATVHGLGATCVESAEFDDEALKAFDGVFPQQNDLDALLGQAGCVQGNRLLSPWDDDEPQVWIAARGYTVYQPAAAFYRGSQRRLNARGRSR